MAAILNPSAGGFYSTATYTGVIPCLSLFLYIRILFRTALTIFSVGLFRKVIRRVRVFPVGVFGEKTPEMLQYITYRLCFIIGVLVVLQSSDFFVVWIFHKASERARAFSRCINVRNVRDVISRRSHFVSREWKFLRLAAKVLRVFKTNACLLIFMTSVLMLGHDVPTRTPCHGDFQRLIPSSRYTA